MYIAKKNIYPYSEGRTKPHFISVPVREICQSPPHRGKVVFIGAQKGVFNHQK